MNIEDWRSLFLYSFIVDCTHHKNIGLICFVEVTVSFFHMHVHRERPVFLLKAVACEISIHHSTIGINLITISFILLTSLN